MKSLLIALTLMLSHAALAEVTFSGQAALDVFNELTGPKVVAEGAMGSTYLTGESIVCRGPNDPESQKNPENYRCKIRFTKNGKILSPK